MDMIWKVLFLGALLAIMGQVDAEDDHCCCDTNGENCQEEPAGGCSTLTGFVAASCVAELSGVNDEIRSECAGGSAYECPDGCCPQASWYCCPDGQHCAVNANYCPSGRAVVILCFSSLSQVSLTNDDKIPINQLKPGHNIKSVNSNGEVISSPFLGWLHHDDNVTTTFLNITTETDNMISISPQHLLMVADNDNVDKSPSMKFASTVRVGNYLWSGESGLVRVKSVTSQVMKGAYAPLTSTGTLLVDDLLASSYAHLSNHEVAHFAFLPYRMFPQALQIQEEFGLAPYLLPIYNILTKLANPMIEVAISVSQSTNYHNPSYVTAGFMAGLISVAIVGTKMKAF